MLDLHALQQFLAIAAHGSITKAARSLRTSQPALTTALRGLEESLGTVLFFRNHNGVTLTRSGAELKRSAEELLDHAARAEARVRSLETDESGTFAVGCHESIGSYVLPSFLKAFLDANPRIEISLFNASSEAVTAAVLNRAVHLGIVSNIPTHPELVLVPLFQDVLDILISTWQIPYPLDAGPERALELAIEALRKGPLIHVAGISQSTALIAELDSRGWLAERRIECGDLELAKSLALAGVGPAILPRRVARYEQMGKLIRLHKDFPCVEETLFLVHRADLHRTKACELLLRALTTHGQALVNGPTMTTVAEH
jgi:DNA-binding transcriptional LysR family regulator